MPLALLVAAAATSALDAPAATAYQCGPGGAPDVAAKRCACPAGKSESTDKRGTSRCLDAPRSAASSKASGAAATPRCPSDMVATPGGAFPIQGRADVSRVAPFCLDKTEVSVDAFARCTAAGKCAEPDAYVERDPDPKWRIACNWKNPGRGEHPVNCLDLAQASAYCAFVGRRLPTEDEWEWAARGGDEARSYPWGNDLPNAKRANVCGSECAADVKARLGLDFATMPGVVDPYAQTAPVGSFPGGATRWGALDLAGNVNEWTSSTYQAGSSNVVVRGGAWDSYQYTSLFTSQRRGFPPALKNATIGLRCAKSG